MSVKVLVVDDNPIKIRRIVAALQDAESDRIAIDIAQSGVDARKALASVRYDLLILDIALPLRPEHSPDRKGGIKLLDEVTERSIYKKPISVVGLTGFSDLYQEFENHFRSRLWTLEYYDEAGDDWVERLKAKTKYIVARTDQKEATSYETDLCVIAALHTPELAALRSLDWGWSSANSLDEVNFYYEGNFRSAAKDRRVISAAAPRMGMVASAILSLKMITVFRPRILAMVGVCAGIKEKCRLGDVILADPSWDWQMGKYENGVFSLAPDQIGVQTAISQRFVQLGEDSQLWFEIHRDFNGPKPDSVPRVLVGPVTSGSAVLADSRVLSEVKEQHRKLLGIEMELYGMYAAARDCSPPAPIVFGIKSVCDYADGKKDDKYQSYASHVSARTLEAFCERYGSDFLEP